MQKQLMRKTYLIYMLFIAVISTSVMAQEKSSAVIILDASGSMWGQIQGEPKINIAKDTLSNVIRDWDPLVELGLTVYGHRKKSDCDDIETMIPAGKVDKNKMLSLVKNIQPKGRTPIARALRKVADEVSYTKKKSTIILISDGKESCDADPCVTARDLEKNGIDFVTHVIGFDVDDKTTDELQCIAGNTGGMYLSANNAEQLNVALQTVVELPNTQVAKAAYKTTLKIEANVETKDEINGVIALSEASARYDLNVDFKRKGEVVTLILVPTVKHYSSGDEALPTNIPGSWTRRYSANGELIDIGKDHDAAYFNWNTQSIFSISFLMLCLENQNLKSHQKWLAGTVYASLPMLEDTEITITNLTDTEVAVRFKNIPSMQDQSIIMNVSGSALYDRQTLLLKSANVKESLNLETKVKRNGKDIVVKKTRQIHYVIEGESS